MTNKLKVEIAVAALLGTIIGSVTALRKNEDKYIPEIEEDTHIAQIIQDRYEFHYYIDTQDIDTEINKLNINNNDYYPFDTYKYIRFVDFEQRERIAIVHILVDFLKDENNNIKDTIYTYVDAFNGNILLATNQNNVPEEYTSDIVKYIMDYGNLKDLKETMISKGLDSNYANSIIYKELFDRSLSTYDAARIYVSLVNSNNRVKYNNEAIILTQD